MTVPFTSAPMRVLPDWIDYNGHLNMAYYSVLFDQGAEAMFHTGIFGKEYRETRGFTTFSAEFHVCYLRELHEGDAVYVTTQLLDFDAKRFHFYQELYHEDGWLSATGEGLGLHIDQSGPRVAAMPDDVQDKLAAMLKEHSALPHPERAGRRIAIPGGRFV